MSKEALLRAHHTWNPKPDKLYLHLWHGRKTKNEEMFDVGYDGGYLGPLEYVETQYGNCIELAFDNDLHHRPIEIFLEDGFFVFNGSFYAHFTTIMITGEHV